MFEYLTIDCDETERRAFCCPNGLWRSWARRYHQLFNPSDVERAATQAPLGRHYHEWLGAIHLHRATAYRCILAKYQFRKKHPTKFETFAALVPARVRALLPPNGRPQGPDLFMYSPAMDDWFFAEVKGIRENVTPSQLRLFPRLERASGGREIRVVRVRRRPELRAKADS